VHENVAKGELTPGKPSSYSPKPTRATKGTAESGLKNLQKIKKIDESLRKQTSNMAERCNRAT
jgi:hypothetical protein